MLRKAVGDALAHVLAGIGVGIERYLVGITEGSQVVDTPHMVVVLMRDEYTVDAPEVCPGPIALLWRPVAMEVNRQHLLTEVGTAVHKEVGGWGLYQGTAAQVMVARVSAPANTALATNHGCAATGASAKKSYFHRYGVCPRREGR
jgi:hypothetical protein